MRMWMARISEVIYGEFQRLFMIKAVILYSIFWHVSWWGNDEEKKQEGFEVCGCSSLKHFLSLLCLSSKYWTSMTFRHFHAKCGLTLALKGPTIPLAIPQTIIKNDNNGRAQHLQLKAMHKEYMCISTKSRWSSSFCGLILHQCFRSA